MDTQTTAKRNVDADVALIKAKMPETYRSILAEASQRKGVFELVRRGLRGEPNCFYAFEAGHVMGRPFNDSSIMEDVAVHMVRYGVSHMWIIAPGGEHKGTANGTH